LDALDASTMGEASPDARRAFCQRLEDAARAVRGAEAILSVSAGASDDRTVGARVHTNGFEGERETTSFSAWVEVSVKDADGRRLVARLLGARSRAVRAQKAAQLPERGFNSGGLSWLTPSLGTVDALAPIDAQPPNLRDEMCGGHRRKPPSEENEEEPEDAATAAGSGAEKGQQAVMLSSPKPTDGQVGPPVATVPPLVRLPR